MSDKIVSLTKGAHIPGDTRPNPLVVETLEQLLADAKAGRIRHLAAIVYFPGTGHMTISVGEKDGLAVMGGCDVLKMRIFNLTQAIASEDTVGPG